MDNDQVRELELLQGILSDAHAVAIKLSYGLLKTITNNFSSKIGNGGFGVVYKGGWQNCVVAVKMLKNVHTLPDELFIREIKCLSIANHQNVVKFLGYCAETQEKITSYKGEEVLAEEPNRLLCFEYVPNGTIRQHLEQESPHRDNWPRRYQMIRGICHGLRYLHDNKIIHLDLKPENIMLNAQMEPKITDFGLSRLLDQGQSSLVTNNIIGTLRYSAPEIYRGEISVKADIHALGMVIIELLTGISSISLDNWDESLDMDCPGMGRCAEIARRCTEPNKQDRPTIHDVITDLDVLENISPRSSVNQSDVSMDRSMDNCNIVPARSLAIAWGDDRQYWIWTSPTDSRFGECAELLSVWSLVVSTKITPKLDQPAATIYTAHLVYRLADNTSGLLGYVQTARTLLGKTVIATSQVSLHTIRPGARANDAVTYPVTTRPDGWLELKLGEFSNERAVTIEIRHEDDFLEKSGLIIKGMEVRRH